MAKLDKKRAEQLLQFETDRTVFAELKDFHEWAVALAIKKFMEKPSNDKPVMSFAFQRYDGITIMNCSWENEHEKNAVFDTVRHACQIDPGTSFVSHLQEVYLIAEHDKAEFARLRAQYGAVRHMPGHVDGLMVQSSARSGETKLTKWEVKLKPNPANNIMRARDDLDMTGIEFRGRATGFFAPVKEIDDE